MAGLRKSRKEKEAFAQALRKIHGEANESKGQISQQQIARQMRVASSAVSSWFGGRQVPRDTHLMDLAKVLAHKDSRLQQEYQTRLYAAAGRNEAVARELSKQASILKEFQEKRKLRVGLVEYSEIGKFFTTILGAFAKFDGNELDINDDELFFDLTRGIKEKRFGLGAPIMASPDRALNFDFIETPILMPVNALTYKGALANTSELSFDPGDRAIRPILNREEVGGRFAIQALGFDDSWLRQDVQGYKPASYASALLECFKQWNAPNNDDEGPPQPVPVVFADELTCLNIQREWLKEDFAGRLPRDLVEPALLFGATGPVRPNIVGPNFLRSILLPKFHVCICVDREEGDWPRYFASAWRIFLHNNSDFVAIQYAQLYTELLLSLEPFERAMPGSNLRADWERRVREWLRFPELGRSGCNAESPLLFSDEGIWNKILASADAMTRPNGEKRRG